MHYLCRFFYSVVITLVTVPYVYAENPPEAQQPNSTGVASTIPTEQAPKAAEVKLSGPESSDDDVQKRIAKLEADLAFLQQNEQAAPGTNVSAIDATERELEGVRRIQLLLEQRAQVVHDMEGLAKQITDLEEQASKPVVYKSPQSATQGSSQSGNQNSSQSADLPSFAELEGLRDEFSVLQLALDRANTEQEAIERNISDLKSDLEEKEKEVRRLKEELEGHVDRDLMPLKLAELDKRIVVEDVALQEMLHKKSLREEKIIELKRAAIQQQIDWRRKVTKLSEQFLQSKLAELDKSEQDFKNSERAARRDLPKAERQWDVVRRRLQTQGESDLGLAELEARRFAKEEVQTQLEVVGRQISLIGEIKLLWTRRSQIAVGSAKLSDLSQWRKEADSRISGLQTAIELATTRQTEIRKTEFAIEGRLEEVRNNSADLAKWLGEQAKSLRKTEQDYFAYIAWLEGNYRLFMRYIGEIRDYKESYNFSERLASVWSGIAMSWNYELFVIEDRPITVSKILLAMLLFAVGYRLSRYLSRQIGRKILPHFNKAQGVAAALEALSFYFLVAFFALFALRVVNVPLTVFTVLGGALAIGVGFGSQNIVNNFISGIILLVEQPIRVGDVIELDSIGGTVQRIGLRSTVVKTGRNIAIVVPNSVFLEKSVTNWTLADDTVSVSISVGVAYGNDLERVRGLLLQAAREHRKILAEPAPSVYLAEFGNLAMCYELHFWIHLFDADRMHVQSDVRARVYELLRAGGIDIPFQASALDTRKAADVKSGTQSLK